MRPVITTACMALLTLFCAGCTATQHSESLPSAQERRVTAGVVQKEIHKGMSQADVAAALGSPNLVTRDKTGNETWIYDKISTEYAYSSSSSGISALVLGWVDVFAGGLAPRHSQESGASSSTQRTLTVIITFNGNGAVDEFSYHASRF